MKNKFYEKLLQLKYDIGLCQEIECTEEENHKYMETLKQKQELPIDILKQEDSNGTKLDKFCKVVPLDISHEELQEYCIIKQTKNLHTIKNCVVFFTILTAISLVAILLLLFSYL